jgi:putative (di)nucleoside polyphosphate hydrolase
VTSATLIAELPGWLSYELPHDLMGVALKGRFAGQRLRWFALRFEGRDSEIDIDAKERVKPEFDAWRWVDIDELPRLALPFKRPLYEAVAEAFAPVARDIAREDASL